MRRGFLFKVGDGQFHGNLQVALIEGLAHISRRMHTFGTLDGMAVGEGGKKNNGQGGYFKQLIGHFDAVFQAGQVDVEQD